MLHNFRYTIYVTAKMQNFAEKMKIYRKTGLIHYFCVIPER